MRENGREPVVWFDRACLNPAYASAQLPALPIYCAACDKLLALRGPTYLARLWCVVEIYVFYEMTHGVDAASASSRIEIIPFPSAPLYTSQGVRAGAGEPADAGGGSAGRLSQLRSPLYQRFDVQQTRCAFAHDEERMLVVIESCGAGFEAFNMWMHTLLEERGAVARLGGPPSGRHLCGLAARRADEAGERVGLEPLGDESTTARRGRNPFRRGHEVRPILTAR